MLGYPSGKAAREDILKHYDDPKYVGKVKGISMEQLHKLIDDRKTHKKLAMQFQGEPAFSTDHPQDDGYKARPPKRRGDIPARDEAPRPEDATTESRQDERGVITVGPLLAVNGYNDLGKTAKVESLGDKTRSWEAPPSDGDADGEVKPTSTGGLVGSLNPRKLTEDNHLGSNRLTLSELGPGMGQKEASPSIKIKKGPSTPMGALDPLHKVAEAFMDELSKVAAENNGVNPWVGDRDDFVSFVTGQMSKEAISFGGIRQGAQQMMGKLKAPKQFPGFTPQMNADVAAFRGGGLSTGYGKDLARGGKMMAHDPQAAGRAAGLGSRDLASLQKMKPTSAGRRIAGETAHGVGHHIDHTSMAGLALNPFGEPMGGGIEGLTRGVGKEMQRSGSAGVQAAGRAMQKHAPKVGLGGEIVAGGLLHTPGLASALGAQLAPTAHGVAQHAAGTFAQSMPKMAPKVMSGAGRLAMGAGRAMGFA
jgi:hypothetical protein